MADEFERQNEKKKKKEQSNQNNKTIQNEYDKQSEEEDRYLIEIQEPLSVEDIYNDYVEHEDYEYVSKPEKEEEEEKEKCWFLFPYKIKTNCHFIKIYRFLNRTCLKL